MRAVTFEAWQAQSEAERAVFVDEMLDCWPQLSRLETTPGSMLPLFECDGLSFVLVPACEVTVGLTAHRYEAVLTALRQSAQVFSPEVHQPVWHATVPMHLAATRPMLYRDQPYFDRWSVDRVRQQVTERGWRFPSEAQYELQFWTLRHLTALEFSPFGDVCRDSWAVSYTLPLLGSSRGEGHEIVRLASHDSQQPASALPSRRPVKSTSLMSVRPVIELWGDAPAQSPLASEPQ